MVQPRLNYKLGFQEMKALLGVNGRGDPEVLSGNLDGKGKIFFFDHARSALQIALMTLPKGSVVGTQPLTCPTVVEAIEGAGCKVAFIDITEQLVIDPEDVRRKVSGLDALIVTHTFGYPANIALYKEIMKDKLIIEDCAHAFMSSFEGNSVGSLGDFSLFSFGFAKFPSAVQGGYLKVNNPAYLKAMQLKYEKIPVPALSVNLKLVVKAFMLSFLNHPIVYTYFTIHLKNKSNSPDSYQKNIRQENQISRSSRPALSLLNYDLIQLNQWLLQQKRNGKRLLESFRGYSDFTICQEIEGMNCFMLPLLTKNPTEWIKKANRAGIELGRHFVKSEYIMPSFGYKEGDCPVYEKVLEQLVTIPCHYNYPEHCIRDIEILLEKYKTIK